MIETCRLKNVLIFIHTEDLCCHLLSVITKLVYELSGMQILIEENDIHLKLQILLVHIDTVF